MERKSTKRRRRRRKKLESREHEKIDVARLFYIAKINLQYTEKEIWRLTIAKLLVLYRQWKKANGFEEKKATIDDIIPF